MTAEDSELLLNELRHRTANNLAMLVSAISRDLREVSDPEGRAALERAIALVQVVADSNRRLTEVGADAPVDLGVFLSAICNAVIHPHDISLHAIPSSTALVPPGQAISIGMIVTEALTNTVKHAFNGSGGEVRVVISQATDELLVEIIDNGTGVSADAGTDGRGSGQMQSLAKGLNATLERGNDPQGGTRVALTIPTRSRS